MGPFSGEHRTWNMTNVRYNINDKSWNNQGVFNSAYGHNRPIQSAHTGGANVLMADGAVRFLKEGISLAVLFNLCNRADGNVVGDY